MRADVYLNFPGNTEEAFRFYQSIFGGELSEVSRFRDTPDGDKLSPEDQEKVMHVSLTLPGGTVLMGTDALESMGQKLVMGNNMSITITPDSREHADELFAKLSDGGTVTMPLQDMFWGDYFGACEDRYGVPWMVDIASAK